MCNGLVKQVLVWLAGDREAEYTTKLLKVVKDIEMKIGAKMKIVNGGILVLCLDQIPLS